MSESDGYLEHELLMHGACRKSTRRSCLEAFWGLELSTLLFCRVFFFAWIHLHSVTDF